MNNFYIALKKHICKLFIDRKIKKKKKEYILLIDD